MEDNPVKQNKTHLSFYSVVEPERTGIMCGTPWSIAMDDVGINSIEKVTCKKCLDKLKKKLLPNIDFKVDFMALDESLLKYVIINGLKGEDIKDGWNIKRLNIAMAVNGAHVDVKKVWKNIESQLDECIEEKAEELIRAKLGDKFSDAVNDVENAIDDLVRKFNRAVEDDKD